MSYSIDSTSGVRFARAALLWMMAVLAACSDSHGPGPRPPVASVVLSDAAVELVVGASRQLGASTKAADGRTLTGRTVVWSSSDTTVARVTDAGLVTGRAAGLATVTATSEGRSAAALVTVAHPAPVLLALAPDSVDAGGAGFVLTLTGSGFAAGAVVRLNGVARPVVQASATELQVEIAAVDVAEPGDLEVIVENPVPGGGASGARTLRVRAEPHQAPVPTIGTLAPSSSAAGGAGFTLEVVGTGFVPASVVTWNGTARPTTYVGATALKADIEAADLAAPGHVQVAVVTPAPGGGSSNTAVFTITPPQAGNPVPVVTQVGPNLINYGSPSQQVLVTGSGFVAASVVRVDGTPRPTEFFGAGALRVTLPASDLANPRTLALTVVNPAPGGGSSNVATVTVRVCCFQLVYDAEVEGRRELLAREPSTIGPVRLLPGVTAHDPSPSPDGRYVAFAGVDNEGASDIYVVDLVTRELQRLTFTGVADQPAWAGQRIAYRRRLDARSSIWVASSLSTPASGPWLHARISPLGVDDEMPAWSPDGSRIAFSSNAAGSVDVWTMNADGGDRRRVTSSANGEIDPGWSPDGLRIVYTHLDAAGAASLRVAASGEGPVVIINPMLGEGRLPAWSPDGETIAFVTRHEGRDHVATMRPDGAARTVVTEGAGGGSNPAWRRQPY